MLDDVFLGEIRVDIKTIIADYEHRISTVNEELKGNISAGKKMRLTTKKGCYQSIIFELKKVRHLSN